MGPLVLTSLWIQMLILATSDCVQRWDLCLDVFSFFCPMLWFPQEEKPCVWTERGIQCCETWWGQAESTSPMFVWNENRGRAKKGSGFGQSPFCLVPWESLSANPGSWAVWWGSSSAGASRHIWKQTFGLRLQPMCQVWCVSGKVRCKDHHPQDWGGEGGKSQMAGKHLLRESTFLFIFLQILFTWSPSSQVHLLSSHKDFFFVDVIPRTW